METRISFELVMMLMLMTFTEHLLCPRNYLNTLCTSCIGCRRVKWFPLSDSQDGRLAVRALEYFHVKSCKWHKLGINTIQREVHKMFFSDVSWANFLSLGGRIVQVSRSITPPLTPRIRYLMRFPRLLFKVLWWNSLFWADFLPNLT